MRMTKALQPPSRIVGATTRKTGSALLKQRDEERTAALEEHRAEIEAGRDIPTLTIIDHRKRLNIRGSCQFCGARGMFNVDVPGMDIANPSRVHGQITCALCARVVCHLVIGAPRPPVQPSPFDRRRGRPPKNSPAVPYENGVRP